MAVSDAILMRLLELHPKIIDLSLDRMWRLLDALDNPQDKLPPVIHIAGTNGKGSTLAYVRADAGGGGPCRPTPIPRRIWCGFTSASGWARQAAAS